MTTGTSLIGTALKGSKNPTGLINTHVDTKTFYTSHEKEQLFWCQGYIKQPKEH